MCLLSCAAFGVCAAEERLLEARNLNGKIKENAVCAAVVAQDMHLFDAAVEATLRTCAFLSLGIHVFSHFILVANRAFSDLQYSIPTRLNPY